MCWLLVAVVVIQSICMYIYIYLDVSPSRINVQHEPFMTCINDEKNMILKIKCQYPKEGCRIKELKKNRNQEKKKILIK